MRHRRRVPQHQALSRRRGRESPPFHDVRTGNNNLFGGPQYPAATGYDLATGWGSPNAPDLVGTFTGAAAGCPSVTNVDPGSGPAVGGTTVTISGSGFGNGVPTVFFGPAAAHVIAHSPTSVTVRLARRHDRPDGLGQP